MARIITENKSLCFKCQDEVISVVEGIYKPCKCGALLIAGGFSDLIRVKTNMTRAIEGEDYMEKSTFLFNEENKT